MLALAGGGSLGSGGALGIAGAGALGILGGGILQMGSKNDGGANSDAPENTEPPKKQGDHIFTKGSQKLGRELREAAKDARLSDKVKGRIGQAANELDEAVKNPAFDTKVNKGPGPAGGDSQSTAFGNAVRAQRVAQREFLEAAEEATRSPAAQQAEANAALRQAGNNLKSANQNVLRNIEDTQASSMANSPKTVQAGRDGVQKMGQAQDSMVDDVIKMVEAGE